MSKTKNNRLIGATSYRVKMYKKKMYKKGRIWLTTGTTMTAFALGLGLTTVTSNKVQAAVTDNQATAQVNSLTSASFATLTTVTSTSEVSQEQTVASSADATTATSSASSADTTTATSSASSADTTTATSSASSTDATSAADSVTATNEDPSLSATSDVADINSDQDTLSSSADSSTSVASQNTVVQSKTLTARTASDAVMSGKIIIGDATKSYDNNVDTPVVFQVSLPDGVNQPESWYLSGQDGTLIALGSGDIDLSHVSQDVGTYTITLTAAGLAKIQAANPNLSISMSDVTAGTLTISKALVPSQSITIAGQSKEYDNDATNMPDTYQVSVPSNLSAPSTWTLISDADGVAVYEVPASYISGVDSQDVGTYQITLSDQGIQDLQTVNSNYEISSDTVMSSTFVIESSISLIAGSTTIMKTEQGGDASLPTTLTVSVSRGSTVPSDWTVLYDNTGQGVTVYNVPISYFDISTVDPSQAGTYEVNLSAQAIADLRNANPDAQLADVNIQAGIVTVSDYVKQTGTFAPGNYFVTIKGRGSNKYISVGAGLELELRLLNTNSSDLIKNLTEYIIIPNGFAVGNIDADGNYSVASDPAAVLKQAIEDELARINSDFSGEVSVQQLTDYKGRQTFKIQFVGEIHRTSAGYEFIASLPIVAIGKEGTSGYIGTYIGANDDSVMYVTSDVNATGGNYSITSSGYDNIRDVANALGITNAYALNQGYTGFVYPYEIVQGSIKDTYNLVGPDGKTVLDTITTTGKSMTTYDPMSFLPAEFEKDGHKYVLVVSSVVTPQKYQQVTTTFADADTVVDGTTYTVYYQEVIDDYDDSNTVAVQNATKIYDGDASTDPLSYGVFVPDGYSVPDDWKATADKNIYTVEVGSGDLDISGIDSQEPGSYTVALSEQGLNKLAAANPMYLITSAVGKSAQFTITPITTTLFVDQDGNQISPDVIDNTHVYQNGDQYTTTAPTSFGNFVLIGTPSNASGNFGDDNIEVTYVYTDNANLDQDVTETIHYVDGQTGQQLADTYTKTVHYSRVAHVQFNSDGTTSVTYDVWQADGSFDAVTSPLVDGHVADRTSIESFDVQEPTADLDLTVYYYGDQTVDPKDPGTPVDPDNPNGPDYLDGTTEADLNQDVTETIHYVDGQTGQQLADTYTKTVHYSRVAHVHFNSDGTTSVTYDAWQADGSFDAVTSPLVDGYVADRTSVESFDVQEPTADLDLTVYYYGDQTVDPKDPGTPVDPDNPNGPDYLDGTTEADLNQDVTETIHYVDGQTGQQLADTYTKTVHYSRVAHVHFNSDGTTSVTYDAWQADGSFDAVTSPLVDGYVADRTSVESFDIQEPTADMVLNVYYTANNVASPDDKKDNGNNDSNTNHQEDNNKTSNVTDAKNVSVGKWSTRTARKENAAKKLPQTGDNKDASVSKFGILGLLAGTFGMFRFAKKRKLDSKNDR